MGEYRAGYATILGKPNVGKSTLLNAVLGEKLAIVSRKPQTTRDRLSGIYSNDNCQIVFVDTPGVIDPKDNFNKALVNQAREALDGVDIVLHMVEADDPSPLAPEIVSALKFADAPLFLVVNKIDRVPSPFNWDTWPVRLDQSQYDERFALSALEERGIDELIAAISSRLPVGEPFFDPEQLCDRDLRYLVAERVREKVFELARQEIPYGVATQTDEFREEEGRKPYISVHIFVERDSQKGVLVGAGGAMIKRIGQEARREIEELMGEPVFLELSVKVRKNWRKNDAALREFGYAQSKKKKSSTRRGERRR